MGGGGAGALGKLGVALSVLFGLFLAVLLLEVLFLLFRGKSKNLRQQLQRELRGQHNQSHGPPPLPPPLYRRQRQRQQRQWRWRKQRRQQREQHGRINTTNNLPGRAEGVHHASASATSSRHHFSREAAFVGSFGGYPSSSSNTNPPFSSSSSSSSSSSAYPSTHSISSMSRLFLADSLQFSPLHGALSSIAEETGAEVDLLPHNATCIPTGANPNNPCAASACPNLRTGFANPNVYTAARSSKLDMLYLARSHNPSASNGLLNADQSPADPDSRINANNIRRESANPRECRDDLEMSANPNVLSQAVGSPPDGGSGGRSPSAAVTVAVTPFTTPPSSPPPPSSMTSSPVTAASHFSAVSVSPGSSSVPGSPMPSRLSVCSNGSVSISLSVSVSGSTATSRFSPSESPVADHHHHGPLGALFRRTYNNIAASPSRPHPLPFRPVHYPASSVMVDFRRALPFSPPNSAAWNNNVS